MDYRSSKEISKQYGERNDCAVHAISLSTGVPYDEVWTQLALMGRRTGKGTERYMTYEVIRKLGFELVNLTATHRPRLVKQLANYLHTGKFMVFVSRHVLAVIDGKVEDWSDGRGHQILDIFMVVPKGSDYTIPEPQIKKPAAPKPGTKRHTIHERANNAWRQYGRPTCPLSIQRVRDKAMFELEYHCGIPRSTSSNELGVWQEHFLPIEEIVK